MLELILWFLFIFYIEILLKSNMDAKIHAMDGGLNAVKYGFTTDSREKLHLFKL